MASSTLFRERSFALVLGAQFFSSVADNALLFVGIGMLAQLHTAAWMTPALRLVFYAAYILFAPWAGAVADAVPKGRVMFLTTLVKVAGCGLLLLQFNPLIAFAAIGLGSAAYAPARYGILPELLQPAGLVAGNAWVEGVTLLAIMLGMGLGTMLIAPAFMDQSIFGSRGIDALVIIAIIYAMSACGAVMIPKIARFKPGKAVMLGIPFRDFWTLFGVLWRDHQAQTSLITTSVFWAIAATLQFMVLQWARERLSLPLAQAALVQLAVAVGMVGGAIAAARWIALDRALKTLPLGMALGGAILSIAVITKLWLAILILAAIGGLSGLMLVPMNALLQHRGQLLMHPGQSIAIQNFSENLSSAMVLGIYGLLVYWDVPLVPTLVGLGSSIVIGMLLILGREWRHRARGSATLHNEVHATLAS